MDAVKLLEKVSDQLSVRRAFGTAYEKDGVLIIPVALVAGGGGGGLGRPGRANPAARAGSPPEGAATAVDTAQQDVAQQDAAQQDVAQRYVAPPNPASMDAGGGFGGLVLPVGVYVVKGDQVRWVSAVDVTVATLASLSLVRMLDRSWTRRLRA